MRLVQGQVRRHVAGGANVLTDLLRDADRERAGQVMRPMLQMSKIDVAELQAAYAQS